MERRAAPPPSPPAPPVANGAAVAPAALASPQTAGLSLPWERWLVPAALVATTAVFIFLAAMLWLGGGNQDIPQVAEAVSTGDAQTEETEPSKTPAGSREKLDDGDDGRAASKDGSPENTATKPDDPPPPRGTDWQRVLADVRGGIFLLEARHPSGQATWPVANACTIRNDTLLTTGTAASALANFQKQGWKISARNPSDGTQRRVEKFLVHRGYQEVPEEADAGKNDPRMYFDLALVTVDAKSSPTSPLDMAPTRRGRRPIGGWRGNSL